MFKKLYSRISRGKEWYHTYRKEINLASNITVKNKQLYEELEQAAKQQDGVLTYAEYLQIDQFGKNGYYVTSKKHGKTDIENRWGDAIVNYCKKFNLETIIEFGCGTGELGVATAKAYKKLTKKKLMWIGVEIDTKIHTKIFDNFKSQQMQDSVKQLVTTLDEVPKQQNALIIFPYSLDNMPPQVFVNTNSVASYPDSLLGITLANGKLSEVIIPQEMMRRKGLKLENGLFTQDIYTCKLSSWKLRKGQRAYIPIDSYITVNNYTKKFGNETTMLIIDEFRKEPWFFNIENLGTPKSLYEHNLICNDRTRYYRESGRHNLYYPLYRDSVLHFLNAIGFQSITYDIEQKKAAELRGKPWLSVRKKYATLAFIARNLVDKKTDILPIPFTPQRIL